MYTTVRAHREAYREVYHSYEAREAYREVYHSYEGPERLKGEERHLQRGLPASLTLGE